MSIWKKTSRNTVQERARRAAAAILFPIILAGCGSCSQSPDHAEYTPRIEPDWDVSTPEEQGLDPEQLDSLYRNAARIDTIQSLLVVKDGRLVAEAYFHDGAVDRKERIQSVTKSFTSALVGIAIDEGLIPNEYEKVLDYFPEIAGKISDPRKKQITIRQLLQMRAGYPWEESHDDLWAGLLSGRYPPLLEAFPLVNNPGTAFHYSNLSSNWLGIIVDRQSGMHMKSFAQRHLFGPLGIEPGDWGEDAQGHNNGCGDLHLTARDMARFGQLYLDGGVFEGNRIVDADWVRDSLKTYTYDAWPYKVGSNFNDIGYGYQWWSVRSGDHRYNLAWGHGGQQIALVHDLGMVIVVTAYPFWLEHDSKSWKYEKKNLNLVADYISEL